MRLMNFLLVLAVISFVMLEAALPTCTPTNKCVRKELRTWASADITKLTNAIVRLNNAGVAPSIWNDFAILHYNLGNPASGSGKASIHSGARFLPWHRQMLRNLELELQKIDPTLCLPYWDWTLDASRSDPWNSPIFRFYGNSSAEKCVPDGPFSKSNFRVPLYNSAADNGCTPFDASKPVGCLTRGLDMKFKSDTFDSAVAVTKILKITDYGAKTTGLEAQLEALHNHFHVLIGGNNGQMSNFLSPADPMFYLHHAFIDKIWYDWQHLFKDNMIPTSTSKARYYGTDVNTCDGRTKTASLSDPIFTGVTVQDVLNSTLMCVDYMPSPPTSAFIGDNKVSTLSSTSASARLQSLKAEIESVNSNSLLESISGWRLPFHHVKRYYRSHFIHEAIALGSDANNFNETLAQWTEEQGVPSTLNRVLKNIYAITDASLVLDVARNIRWPEHMPIVDEEQQQ